MRIAQVVTYISQDGAFGGPVAVALAQSVELARQGHSVHLYAGWDGVAQVVVPGVTLHLFRVHQARLGLAGTFSTSLLVALRRRLSRFDAVHLHFGRDLLSLSTWIVAQGARRVVLQPHGMVMPDRRLRTRLFDRLVVRAALKRADTVLALTEAETKGLIRVARAQINVRSVNNGVHVPKEINTDRTNPPEVLFLARLHPRKQVLVFAESARRLITEGSTARFCVVGPDEGDLPELRRFITAHRLSTRLSYGGSVGPGEGIRKLAQAAVFVLPSVGEVYPMTVLEAVTVGTPVILSSDCGLATLLEPARAAKIVDPNPGQLAKAISELVNDEPQRHLLAQQAHKLALSTFSIEAVTLALIESYAGVSS